MKRPSRTDLLAAISSLQWLVGKAQSSMNDRNPNRAAEVGEYLKRAHDLCIECRQSDPPTAGKRSRFYDLDARKSEAM